MKYAIATIIFAVLMALFLVMALTVNDAGAAEVCGYISKPYRNNWTGDVVYRRVYSCRPERHYYAAPRRDYDEERWDGRRDSSLERGEACKDQTVRVVGGAHLTKEGAINDAVRQWQSTVRYDYGERFMDLENARGYRWRCDRAGTNETLAGRVGEAITGGSGYQRRCVVLAVPCRQPMLKGDKDNDR